MFSDRNILKFFHIIYLLIAGRISEKFFNSVDIKQFGRDYIPVFNKFYAKFIEKKFNNEIISIEFDSDLEYYNAEEDYYKNVPMIDFLPYVTFPYNNVILFKVAESFCISENPVTIKELEVIDFQFETFILSIENAKMINEFQFKFKPGVTDICKDLLFVYQEGSGKYDHASIEKWM